MERTGVFHNVSATHLVAATFGVLSGLGGLRHGIGEALQGSVKPDGIFIESWTTGPLATNMGGEPGMTVIPNMLITGILTIVVSLVVIFWSLAFVQREHGGLVLLLLSVGMLMVGGGVGPPVVGMLAAIAGGEINNPHQWWRGHVSSGMQHLLASAWPWAFGAGFVNGALLFVASLVLVYGFDFNNPDLFLYSFYLAIVLVPLGTITAIAHDMQRGVLRT